MQGDECARQGGGLLAKHRGPQVRAAKKCEGGDGKADRTTRLCQPRRRTRPVCNSVTQTKEARQVAIGGPQARRGEGHKAQAPTAKNHSSSLSDRRNPNPRKRCANCEKPGHNQEKCWFLHPNLRPKKEKAAERGRNREKSREAEM